MARKAKAPLYEVRVWDHESQTWIFPPMNGQEPALWVGSGYFQWWQGPYSLWKLRQMIRMLAGRGYDVGRGSPSVFISRVGWEEEYATKAKPFGKVAK